MSDKKKFNIRAFSVLVVTENSQQAPESSDIVEMLCHNLITLPNKHGAVKVELDEDYRDASREDAMELIGERKTSIMNNLGMKRTE